MFRRIVYISRSLTGGDPDATEAIVAAAIRANAQADITGMLWVSPDNFAQVIEGEADAVGRAMDRIRADGRHTDLEVLVDGMVSSRQFGSWSMRQAGDDAVSVRYTAFMLGLSVIDRTCAARRLHDIILASDGIAD